MKTAWVFPGQGSQAIGMDADLAATPAAQARFAEAEALLNWSVLATCQSDETRLGQTQYTQPCLYVVECALVDLAHAQGFSPSLVAGHSLGEYVALYAAGVFDFATGLQLVQQRSQLMAAASGGKMTALIGFDRDQLNTLLQETPDVVLANDNSEAQVVISGTVEAVDQVVAHLKTKRSVPLNVSGAFHSPLMADAAAKFQATLADIPFQDATVPVLSNIDPTPSQSGEVLKARLEKQMTGPVRWWEISQTLPSQAIEEVWEIGPGKVLTGLIKRSCPGLALRNIAQAADLAAILA